MPYHKFFVQCCRVVKSTTFHTVRDSSFSAILAPLDERLSINYNLFSRDNLKVGGQRCISGILFPINNPIAGCILENLVIRSNLHHLWTQITHWSLNFQDTWMKSKFNIINKKLKLLVYLHIKRRSHTGLENP